MALIEVYNARLLLEVVAAEGCLNIAQYLLEMGADVNQQNWRSGTALEAASRYGQIAILQVCCIVG